MNLDLAIISGIVALNFILFLVIFMGGRGRVNVTFSVFIFFITLWSVANYLAEILNNAIAVRLLVGLTYAAAIIIVTLFLRFVSLFPENESRKLSTIEIICYSTSFLFVLISFTRLITDEVIITDPRNLLTNGPAIYAYILYLILVTISSFAILFAKYSRLKGTQRHQIIFVIIGALLTVAGAILTNLVIPLITGNYEITRYGPYFSIFLIAFSTYAILKHHLFSVKVIATEVITFALWMFILIRTILAENTQDLIIEASLLAVTIIFGIFLIRSVLKEVEQRERIEALAADLQKANVRLTELDRQKSELRAPLTAMKWYGSMLLDGDMGTLTKEAREGISRIYDSTATLINIVEDYLNITRIELGTMKYAFDTIDLRQLIEDVIAELKPSIDKAPIKWSFTAEAGRNYRVVADRDKLKQVITNLIDNSLKYTPSGKIEASISQDEARRKVVFSIKDTGIGISPEVLPRLFQKFSRANNANKVNIRGTGLGLYVAKEIIESHHGTLRAESAGEGKGTTFVMDMDPFSKAE